MVFRREARERGGEGRERREEGGGERVNLSHVETNGGDGIVHKITRLKKGGEKKGGREGIKGGREGRKGGREGRNCQKES